MRLYSVLSTNCFETAGFGKLSNKLIKFENEDYGYVDVRNTSFISFSIIVTLTMLVFINVCYSTSQHKLDSKYL